MFKRNFITAAILAVGVFTAVIARASVIDLTGAGSSATINGGLFFESNQQPAGTGFIQSFLRVQGKGYEQGYNTDGGFPFDDKNPHNFQHSVQLGSLESFAINGTSYFKFMLDANQAGGPHGSFPLDKLQFYTSNDPNQTTTVINPDGTLNLGHLAYNLDAGTDNTVITHSTGSGKFDLTVYIPTANFNQADKYLYLYFASSNATGGFEEWTAAGGVTPVPEMGALFPIVGLMAAVLSTNVLRRRRMAQLSARA